MKEIVSHRFSGINRRINDRYTFETGFSFPGENTPSRRFEIAAHVFLDRLFLGIRRHFVADLFDNPQSQVVTDIAQRNSRFFGVQLILES